MLDPTWIPFGESTLIPGLYQDGKFVEPGDGACGMTDDEFQETQMYIRYGIPVALGRGHSQAAVGYVVDSAESGGGTFIMRDSYGYSSGDNGYQTFSYDNIKSGICDAYVYRRKLNTPIMYGPVSINPMAFDYAVYGSERVSISDRAELYKENGSQADLAAGRAQANNANVDVGNSARVGNIRSRGNVLLRGAVVTGNVEAETYSEQAGTQVSGEIDLGPQDPFEILRTDTGYFNGMFANVQNRYVERGQTLTIVPDVEYGDIYVRDGGQLVFNGSGAFFVRKLFVEAGGLLDMPMSRSDERVVLYTPNDLNFGSRSRISGDGRYMLFVSLGSNVYIGPDALFRGTIVAPLANINVDDSRGDIWGAFHGRIVTSSPDTVINHAPFWY